MFMTVKALTENIDTSVAYLKDAKMYHNCSKTEYEEYLAKMYSKLDKQLEELKNISCNHKLINTYVKKVEEIKND